MFPVLFLSTKENAKLLQQLKSGFKSVINWNKYLSKPELLIRIPNLNYLVEPSFQGVNRLFILAFENDTQRASHSNYYLPNVELKNCNVTINLTVCSYHVTYAFQSESTFCSCLNVKELLAQSRREI